MAISQLTSDSQPVASEWITVSQSEMVMMAKGFSESTPRTHFGMDALFRREPELRSWSLRQQSTLSKFGRCELLLGHYEWFIPGKCMVWTVSFQGISCRGDFSGGETMAPVHISSASNPLVLPGRFVWSGALHHSGVESTCKWNGTSSEVRMKCRLSLATISSFHCRRTTRRAAASLCLKHFSRELWAFRAALLKSRCLTN